MNIKVCGMTQWEQLKALDAMGADYAGLIFYERSPRYAAAALAPHAADIRTLALKKAGVFVNAARKDIEEQVETYGLSLVQLHGDESPEFCLEVQSFVPVVKALRIGPDTPVEALLDRYRLLNTLLFDTDSRQYGGSGQKFDWSVLQTRKLDRPFFLSGGIGPEDADRLRHWTHPHLFALDINSRFESAPGVKNLEAVRTFLNTVKSGYGKDQPA